MSEEQLIQLGEGDDVIYVRPSTVIRIHEAGGERKGDSVVTTNDRQVYIVTGPPENTAHQLRASADQGRDLRYEVACRANNELRECLRAMYRERWGCEPSAPGSIQPGSSIDLSEASMAALRLLATA